MKALTTDLRNGTQDYQGMHLPSYWEEITADNDADLAVYPAYLRCGTGGTLKVDTITPSGTRKTATFSNCFGGQIIPGVFVKVYATGTTVGGIVGGY